MFFGQDPDRMMIDYGLCTFCLGRGCPMCEGTGEHENRPMPTREEEKDRMKRREVNDKINRLSGEIFNLEHELKQVKIIQQKNIVDNYTKMLLKEQDKSGKLDELTIRLFLQDFAVDVKNLEKR